MATERTEDGIYVPDGGTSGGRWIGTLARALAALALSAVLPKGPVINSRGEARASLV